jgi:hypothetical protein
VPYSGDGDIRACSIPRGAGFVNWQRFLATMRARSESKLAPAHGTACGECMTVTQHNRKRATGPPSAAEVAAREEKLRKYQALMGAAMSLVRECSACRLACQRQARTTTPEALAVNGKALLANPDVSTLWNHRKEILLALWPCVVLLARSCSTSESPSRLTQGELDLTELALSDRNPKSYGAWYHRQWVVEQRASLGECSVESELTKCGAPGCSVAR